MYRCLDDADSDSPIERQALQLGSRQVAAGYANYSSATSFVAAVAGGGAAVEFDVDRADGEFRVASSPHGALVCPPRWDSAS